MSDEQHRLADAEPSDQPADAGDIAETLPNHPPAEKRHTVSESADKIVVTTTTKRGTATRDEDKLRLKVKGDDPEAVVEKLNATLRNLHDTTTKELRAMQPEVTDDE